MVKRSDFMVLPDGQHIRREAVSRYREDEDGGVSFLALDRLQQGDKTRLTLPAFEALLFGEPAPAAADPVYVAAAVKCAEADAEWQDALSQQGSATYMVACGLQRNAARAAFLALYRERNR